jgi:hypothetical protein
LPASAGAASLRLASISLRGFPVSPSELPINSWTGLSIYPWGRGFMEIARRNLPINSWTGLSILSVGARLHGDRAADLPINSWTGLQFIRGGAASWRSRGGLANQFLDGASIYPWGRGELIRHTFPNHNICFKIHISCFLRHLATK